MDLSDTFVVLGALLLVIGLALTHPALVLAVIGYAALSHGLNRSR